jgi:hypothetical protein
MSKRHVKEKETRNVTFYANWNGALLKAEDGLRKALRDVMEWKATIRVCRKRIADGARWPGSATQN